MPPSSNRGGSAALGRTQNARRAAVSLTKSIPRPTPPHLERRRLCGVGNIEPNDGIGQPPAVLSLPSLVAIGWIILERFGRSGPHLEKMR
jgi:hypothetical protein